MHPAPPNGYDFLIEHSFVPFMHGNLVSTITIEHGALISTMS